MKLKRTASGVLGVLMTISVASARAAVTSQEAEQLKTTLTPFGAEKAGNPAGTIPAWTGGDTTPPPGYVSGRPRPDPFSNERPLVVITANNYQAYASKLPSGAIELLRRFPETQIDVYPTHRTSSAPQYVYDHTYRNATSAQLIDDGNGITGVFAGIPFPIPKSGIEVLWNHTLRWQGVYQGTINFAYVVSSNGTRVLVASTHGYNWAPYYDLRYEGVPLPDGAHQKSLVTTLAPAYDYGQAQLFYETLDPGRLGTPAWQYLVGQRRVRKAPNLQYDVPNSVFSGVSTFDEFNGFYGSPDHYTWKLLGKREIFIPYNDNNLTNIPVDQELGPHVFKPGTVRWELHRVWVVEGDLAPGARDTRLKRTMYMDEDSWQIVAQDEYDANGNYWKFMLNTMFDLPEYPTVAFAGGGFIWDFHAGDYQAVTFPPSGAIAIAKGPLPPPTFFTSTNLASSGTR